MLKGGIACAPTGLSKQDSNIREHPVRHVRASPDATQPEQPRFNLPRQSAWAGDMADPLQFVRSHPRLNEMRALLRTGSKVFPEVMVLPITVYLVWSN